MIELDKATQNVLKDLYEKMGRNEEISISAPEYKQIQIDAIIYAGLLTKIDASTLSGWCYVVRPTYAGQMYLTKLNTSRMSKIEEFIERGIEIGKKEHKEGFGASIVGGPLFDAWLSEINIFNERYLKNHPLHDSIFTTYFHRKNINAYGDMMGYLRALAADSKLLDETPREESRENMRAVKSIDQLLSEDIERCERYLTNPADEKAGQNLYIEITGRYDSIIKEFGNGLYQYFAEQHFYDPEVSGDSLIHNIKTLLSKMTSYQAVNFPPKDNLMEVSHRTTENKRIFIVHGHDTETRDNVELFIRRLGLEPVVLSNEANQGRTIIQKFEENSDVSFAIILYTACDEGRAKGESALKNRARQNVLFEHGFFYAKLGKENVVALHESGVEIPSDLAGVLYTSLDGDWKGDLKRELKAAGFQADWTRG